ncbi:hypothetical protein KFE25_012725 [Diacronema lutheri]|uniref:DUF3611 family protein n=1 Tax=Diacronema lutheri TaxID=2081491 RepID=A0A8J5XCA0_DIALT|nr:hypothetical protein KFE25_012725 [Diacronema lutheri]
MLVHVLLASAAFSGTPGAATGRAFVRAPCVRLGQPMHVAFTAAPRALTARRCCARLADAVDSGALRESRAFGAASWFSWWGQVILSVVSTVTLTFANAARGSTNPLLSGIVLSTAGVLCGFVSTFWMWGYQGFAKRLLRADVDLTQLATQARRSLRLGISINLVGMALTLISAEQTIGVLAGKALTQGLGPAGGQFGAGLANAIQPIDLLILQANTNTLLSLYIGLCTSLWLRQRRFVSRGPQ